MQKNAQTFKARMASHAAEKKQYDEKIMKLEQEITTLKTAPPVQSSQPGGPSSTPAQTEEIEKQKAAIVSLLETCPFVANSVRRFLFKQNATNWFQK